MYSLLTHPTSLSPCRPQIEKYKVDLQRLRVEEADLEQQASGARERAASLKADANSTQQQGGIVSALMEAKAKGEVSGVYGRLGAHP